MLESKLQIEIQNKINKKIAPLFSKYNMDFSGLESSMKWKPIVLIIGNYSSGKSTLINEIIGSDVQRTGQAPTDDSFTVITSEGSDKPQEVPGSTLINDDNLPFVKFKKYGEKLTSHLCLKNIDSPDFENMAIIDSPGMLDATTEKDRGYDYMEVLGEFAKMADLIVLMFDPHKAGTIKETYAAIRNTLPEKSGEDRIVFVLSRIDECDNISDLVRSYGTLCWNMSQMTGRKDIPHIYLTYSSDVANSTKAEDNLWPQERTELIEKIHAAPTLRLNHILEDIDRQVNELYIVCEAMTEFTKRGRKLFGKVGKTTVGLAIGLFCFGDVLTNSLISLPKQTLISSLRGEGFSFMNLIIPLIFLCGTLAIGVVLFNNFGFKRLLKNTLSDSSQLVKLDNEYRRHLWKKMAATIDEHLQKSSAKDIWHAHSSNLVKIRRFLDGDLKKYYDKLRS
ncbi:dynamin family protein [Desulfotalea psychrophila]|nr:dynamin family protein [Desulfocapsa sp.]MBN4048689.1 dynamin family protein [bacterium AH-315-N22]MBN4071605.1 dynamin family protein [Desulfotalea psychrophila]